MSLLMDALRKAEADKKAAAAREAGIEISDARSRTDELRLEPLSETTGDSLSLSPTGEFSTTQTNPRLSSTGRLRQDFTDPTLADELLFVRPAESTSKRGADSLARPELVTPTTVFAAIQPSGRSRATWIIASVLVGLLAGVATVGYRLYVYTPPPLYIPSPRIADSVERPLPTPPPPSTPQPVEVLPAPMAPVIAITPPSETRVADAMQAVVAPPAPTPVEPPAPAHEIVPAPLAQDFEMRNGDLRITRTPQRDFSPRLRAAYQAVAQGDFASAERIYTEVLAKAPTQADALLGMGAIAMQRNRREDAHRYYSAVLREVPDHPVATAARFLIEGTGGTAASEAKLKLLLDQGVEAPFLHFSLGVLYAREARWGDAQQAFFEAYRGQPRNADYAFNLAVSLDRLGQGGAALDYYRRALASADRHAQFAPADVERRIASLTQTAATP